MVVQQAQHAGHAGNLDSAAADRAAISNTDWVHFNSSGFACG
jgi:hypothetical protein